MCECACVAVNIVSYYYIVYSTADQGTIDKGLMLYVTMLSVCLLLLDFQIMPNSY